MIAKKVKKDKTKKYNKEDPQQETIKNSPSTKKHKRTKTTSASSVARSEKKIKKDAQKAEKVEKKKKAKAQAAIVIKGNFVRVKLSGSLLKFSSLYTNEKVFVKLLITFIVSIVSAFIGVVFVQNTGLYNVGFESFAQGIGRLASFLITSINPSSSDQTSLGYTVFNSLFWSLIIVVNIPLIIFGWYKIGKQFTLYTTFYIVLSSIVGLAFGFIKPLEHLFIFSNLTPESVYALYNVQILEWDASVDATKHLAIFIYGFIYGILQALCYAVLFIIGCSSGGLDFLVVWYAEKKYKNLGTIFTYCNIFCFVISYVIGTYVPTSLVLQNVQDAVSSGFANSPDWLNTNIPSSLNWLNDNINSTNSGDQIKTFKDLYENFYKSYENGLTSPFDADILFSPNFLSTIIMSIVLGLVINLYFPKYQMCKVEIHSRRSNEIRDLLISQNKPYSISIYTIEGGYSRQPQNILVTNCMFIDAANLLDSVRDFDPNALLIVTLIKSIDGYVYLAAKKEEKLALFKFFKNLKLKFINQVSKVSETPHDIELKSSEQVALEKENQVVDDSNVEKIEMPGLDFIEASEVYDEELEKAHMKEIEEQKQQAAESEHLKENEEQKQQVAESEHLKENEEQKQQAAESEHLKENEEKHDDPIDNNPQPSKNSETIIDSNKHSDIEEEKKENN